MTTHLISFGTKHYRRPLKCLGESARPHFDNVLLCDEDTPLLSLEWRQKNAGLLRYSRGYGFWCWKPEIILRYVQQLGPDDILMYCDSQIRFIADPRPLFDLCRTFDGVALFGQQYHGHTNRQWTKRQCLIDMHSDDEVYHCGYQVNAAFSLWMNRPKATDLLKDWSHWCCNYSTVSDDGCGQKEYPDFVAHRHDQSILSLLSIPYGAPMLPDPSQHGDPEQQRAFFGGRIVEFKRIVTAKYPIPCLIPSSN